MPFTHELRVRFNECDPQGVVFHANYLTYVSIAQTALWREIAGGYDNVVRDFGVNVMAAHASLEFRSSARFDEVIEMRTSVLHLGRSSLRLAYELSVDRRPVASCDMAYVCVDANGRTAPMPARLRELLGRPALAPAQ